MAMVATRLPNLPEDVSTISSKSRIHSRPAIMTNPSRIPSSLPIVRYLAVRACLDSTMRLYIKGNMLILLMLLDPKYEEEVSGCTACVGLITGDKVYIVCAQDTSYHTSTDTNGF